MGSFAVVEVEVAVEVSLELVQLRNVLSRRDGRRQDGEVGSPVHMGLMAPILREMRPADAKPADFVFIVNGHPFDDRDVMRRFIRPAAQRLGIYFEGFGWRTFRRLNITALPEGPNPLNVFEAVQQAGHTKPETTMRYTHVKSANREQAVLNLQRRLLPVGITSPERFPQEVREFVRESTGPEKPEEV